MPQKNSWKCSNSIVWWRLTSNFNWDWTESSKVKKMSFCQNLFCSCYDFMVSIELESWWELLETFWSDDACFWFSNVWNLLKCHFIIFFKLTCCQNHKAILQTTRVYLAVKKLMLHYSAKLLSMNRIQRC